MRILSVTSVLAAFLALTPPTASAQTGSSNVLTYKLEPDARYETGCFSMCACPIVTHPIKGTFKLQHDHFDPLFDYYTVSDVRWVVTDATTYFTLTGSGVYKIGGEFAVQQQLILDLSKDGEPPLHFDSGLVFGNNDISRIVIDISRNQKSACVDTVIHVDATDPVATAVEEMRGSRVPWVRVAPNPFRHDTEFRLSVPQAARVEVVLFDASGRAVRHLRSGWVPSGVHAFQWDGRRDQGSECAQGVYYVGARIGARKVTSRIVKLD